MEVIIRMVNRLRGKFKAFKRYENLNRDILVGNELTKEEVPIGSEVWLNKDYFICSSTNNGLQY